MSTPGGQYSGTQRVTPKASLEISNNSDTRIVNYPLTGSVITIGRHPASDIVLDFPFVSASHLRIERKGVQFMLIHPAANRTTNGLWYRGKHIAGDAPFSKLLVQGDVFRIGDEHGLLVSLTFKDESDQGNVANVRPISLSSPEISIGRLPQNSVVLNHPQVSASHARLVREQQTYRLIDLGSTNHVYVNGQQVVNYLLHPQDEIRIGPYKFSYTGTQLIQYDESGGIQIEARHLKKYGNNRTILLNDISLTIPPRKFVALLGGSGAGKSTLLSALNGFQPADEGSVSYNGQDYYRSQAAFSAQLGYVPQDDIVHRDLSVERVLYYAAKMRLPEDFTPAQIEQRINEVLTDVEMHERRSLLISKLSGGQRKRVSIALELLAKPGVFFLDEPTSGLDAGLDLKMMLLLRQLADQGRTIVLVTHTISNINICDYIAFLAPGGYLAYFGPPQGALSYFQCHDIAQIYNLLEPTPQRPSAPEEAAERFKQAQPSFSIPLNTTGAPAHSQRGRKSRRWRQFWLLCRRYLELLLNDRGNLLILALQAPIISLILMLLISFGGSHGAFDPANVVQCPTTAHVLTPQGLPDLPTPYNPPASTSCAQLEKFLVNDPRGQTYAASRGGVSRALQDFVVPGPGNATTILFIMAFAALMFGSVNAAREIVKEGPIYKRERAVNLGILPYMGSKICVLGILCLLQSLVLVLAVNAVAPFEHSIFLPPLLEVYITVTLTALAGLLIGLALSALAPNNDRAMSFIPLLLIPQVIFSGTLFPLKNTFLQFLGFFIPLRWAMAALGSIVGIHIDKLNGDALFQKEPIYHGTLYSLYDQGTAQHYLLLVWLVLSGTCVLFICLTAYFLKRKDNR